MKIGFIGAGKMAEAIVSAFVSSKSHGAHQMYVSDVSAERRRHMKKGCGVNTYSKNDLVVDAADVIFLAVKPQNLDEVLREISGGVSGRHLLISIAAGKKISIFFMSTIGPGEKKQKLTVNDGNSVGDVKKTVGNIFGLNPNDFHLSSGGVRMDEGSALKDYSVNEGDDVLLIPASTAGLM